MGGQNSQGESLNKVEAINLVTNTRCILEYPVPIRQHSLVKSNNFIVSCGGSSTEAKLPFYKIRCYFYNDEAQSWELFASLPHELEESNTVVFKNQRDFALLGKHFLNLRKEVFQDGLSTGP